MRRIIVILVSLACTGILVAGTNTEILFLSGTGSDQTVNWEFMVSGGRKAGLWTEIPVPSCWELQGFGTFNYGHDENKGDETGTYRHPFTVPGSWTGRRIFIVFEGAMTDTEVTINGKTAGPLHQGGFYPFRFDITELVRIGEENRLEARVSKMSANPSINAAERTSDYWVFGGIYRPVYLQAVPEEFLARTAIDARHDGSFSIDVYPGRVIEADTVSVRIVDPGGFPLSEELTAAVGPDTGKTTLRTRVAGGKAWTAEDPNLYYADISLRRGASEIHSIRERFGFRTIEVREGEGIFLNGAPVVLKGVDRHSFRPDTGRALSRQDCLEDVREIKAMNMNAVRMSHYPPDRMFLDLCDELGLYVLDELAGWQKPPYDTPTGERLVAAMVARDVNHPCVLFWDNGNEGGWNRDLDDDYALWDPQNRRVLHPFELHGGIDTDHYESYQSTTAKLASGHIFMPTEFLHGLYDGGLGAGLDDYWKLMWGNPLTGGMFLWVFADEGVVRGDRNGLIDTDGNHAPDGILGPHGEREASYYTIREIWSPLYFESSRDLPPDFTGRIPVENRYDFTNLNQCRLEWELIRFRDPGERLPGHIVLASGESPGPDLAPRSRGEVTLDLPFSLDSADALRVSAFDWKDRLLNTWTWSLPGSRRILSRIVSRSGPIPSWVKDPEGITVTAGITSFIFDSVSGELRRVRNGGHLIPFGCGPSLQGSSAGPSSPGTQTSLQESDSSLVLNVDGHPDFRRMEWTVYGSGWLKLDYEYEITGPVDYLGISFNYPEERMQEMTWLGKGPYRVWKNRMKGGTLDAWSNASRSFKVNTAWEYPEFPGYYADFRWVDFSTSDGTIVIATSSPDLFLRVYRQEDGEDPRHTAMKWPGGDISLLHAIPPIGTKFLKPGELGPQGERFNASGPCRGTVWFYFGQPGRAGAGRE